MRHTPADQDVIEPRLSVHRHSNLAGEFSIAAYFITINGGPIDCWKEKLLRIAAAPPFKTYKHTLNGLNRR